MILKTHFSLVLILGLLTWTSVHAQLLTEKHHFTEQDTLRGSITPEREWWDLTYYHLDIAVDPDKKFIAGKTQVQYRVLKPYQTLQIDLQAPLIITKAIQNGKELSIKHNGNAHFITLIDAQKTGTLQTIDVYYEGHPRAAKRAPWDGGISWKKDANGNDFIASSCQGLGASVWWPNKDHMYDEVDSMLISVNVPKHLMNVSNGILKQVEQHDNNTTTYHWFVNNPINNYGVNINIGDYVNFSEDYNGEKGLLKLDYYVLRNHLEKAKKQFKQVPMMMTAFEHWFGPYPFYEDSFKLVEAPYLGMEHQSSVTYGNQYKNGYLGRDLSGSGWGLKFDFIIIHEAGHEWFANNITNRDIADMWIHESFTNYSESLYLDYHFGKTAAEDYVIGLRQNIQNDKPIIGNYDVNNEGSSDMYYKGANMLHTIRQLVQDDNKWRQILRGLNSTFYHQTVSTQQVEDYISQQSQLDLSPIFDQYLRTVAIPTLEYKIENGQVAYRFTNCIPNFEMPLLVYTGKHKHWIQANTSWQYLKMPSEKLNFMVDRNFYINTKAL